MGPSNMPAAREGQSRPGVPPFGPSPLSGQDCPSGQKDCVLSGPSPWGWPTDPKDPKKARKPKEPWEKGSWPARLELVFSGKGGRTVLSRMRRSGPLAVQRLFYPEAQESFRAGAASAASPAQPAEAYILHPPGGLVRGDSLFIEAQAREGARILLSQASAAKIYGIGRPRARHMAQRQAIWVRVGPGSELEWLPLESIVFDGAMASLSGHFVLDEEARLVVSDILCLGRPASGAPFLEGSLDSKLSLVRPGGRPIYWDNLVLEGGSPLISGLPGLMGQSVSSFFLAAGRCGNAKDESALETAMEKLRPLSRPGPLSGLPPYRGISLREGLLTARSLGQSGAEAKAFALAAWQCLRPLLLGRPAYGLRGWGP